MWWVHTAELSFCSRSSNVVGAHGGVEFDQHLVSALREV